MSPISNEARCTSCHAGYGWRDAHFDFSDKSSMDCLVCHDTTGTYDKSPKKAGLPAEDVDLKYVAENVGHTSRQTCGSCHFNGGGGDAIKHADLSRALRQPQRSCDVHMGGYDFRCTTCHETRNHRISGRSSSVPVAEGKVSCRDCHGQRPHAGDKLIDHHLNEHGQHLDCNTCHSPVFAKCQPTKTWWDWSKAGNKQRQPQKGPLGMPDYHVKKGEFKWRQAAKPSYAWFNGHMDRVLLGDKVNPNKEVINITEPVGSRLDPASRITPFKVMKGVQALDATKHHFLVPHLFPRGPEDKTAYWKHFDWAKAFEAGMEEANLPYSGQYQWQETWMYWRMEHEVMPADLALSCAHCHPSLDQEGEKTCNRCHQDKRDVKFKELARKRAEYRKLHYPWEDLQHLQQKSNYLDFEALGYEGDPIIHGGRFTQLPFGDKPQQKEADKP